jgi:hypothetical protein
MGSGLIRRLIAWLPIYRQNSGIGRTFSTDSYLLQRVSQSELWDIAHDQAREKPDHPSFYCVFAGGLVKFWPPLTDDIVLKCNKMRVLK